MAVEHFYARGHRRIAMICEERDNWGTQQRIEGFTAAMHAHDLPVDERTTCFTEHQAMYGLLHKLTGDGGPSGLFVANESLGLEAAYILQHVLRVKVPGDISLLGMESPQVSQFISPPMSTICQPLTEIADRALEVAMQQMSDKDEPVRVLLDNRLIERESVSTFKA
jgi:DNA-binding LacI/PurR family transcriptional regulator